MTAVETLYSSEQDAIDILRLSAIVDADYYMPAAGIPASTDPVAHYFHFGSKAGLRPNLYFDAEFLKPFYDASGFAGIPPVLVWLQLSETGSNPPRNMAEALHLAESLRGYHLFDAATYASRLPAGMDALLHYVIVGEILGWRPSVNFDPAYYIERYPDIGAAGISPLSHYRQNGESERRRATSVTDRLSFDELPSSEKPVVLVVTHEASRTGAPILAWNLIRHLSESATVIALLMRGGSLEPDFDAVAACSIGPLIWDEWHAADAARLAQRIASMYRPTYAITNSVETNIMVPALTAFGIPCVALIHEFAAYTRPIEKMRNVYDWASHIVFPARIVAQSSFDSFSWLEKRSGIHVLAQGANSPPTPRSVEATKPKQIPDKDIRSRMRPKGSENAILVLGAGAVQVRKGVDLFISAASAAKRMRPDIKFRFVWIGHGYDPVNDSAYSAYIAYQIAQSDLGDSFDLLGETDDIETAYAASDIFFLSSRLDPQPNVGIDALTRGIPTVCFEGACGTAEILAEHAVTRKLVVPHLDCQMAASVICELASDRKAFAHLRKQVKRVAVAAYDMKNYVDTIDRWGRSAAAALRQEDFDTLIKSAVIDPDFALPPDTDTPSGSVTERTIMQQWSLVGLHADPTIYPQFRRPVAGFHPQAYALAFKDQCGPGLANPVAHWVRNGQPAGPWAREVFFPDDQDSLPAPPDPLRVAVHIHFYYETLAFEFLERLRQSDIRCDLFFTTDTDDKARHLRRVFEEYGGALRIVVLPNRGRDIGPFVTEFLPFISKHRYDVIGHFHSKRSLDTNKTMGENWRHFLLENLLGGEHAMLDLVVKIFAAHPHIGLLMAEDPHIVGWNSNKSIGEDLARTMGIKTPLADFFDFPLGTMFWCRPQALAPLTALDLKSNDFPAEPVGYDGTILHAMERLMPSIADKAGFRTASLRVPLTTW